MNAPTDLTDAETRRARERLTTMADTFAADGDIQSPRWREVFTSTWRHPYIPAYYPSLNEPAVLCLSAQRSAWLDAVYSDHTLITKVAPVELTRGLRPARGWMFTSSSTQPSLMLRMLETLEVFDGARVLEIGTGTGYNAALLCERLGSEHVTSVDVDPELIDLARERLAANGYRPTLAALDGADGYPPGGPYDRIIATCGVRRIPPAWLAQAAPGAMILTDLRGPLGGTLVRLSVTTAPDATPTATGRFLPFWAGFMDMRHSAEPDTPTERRIEGEPDNSTTDLDPLIIQHDQTFTFAAQWQLPDLTWALGQPENGQWQAVHFYSRDHSWAEVDITPTGGVHHVRQAGPRRLWDAIERIHQHWQQAGQPGYDRYGLTATPDRQHVWLDEPTSDNRWLLP